MVNGRGTPIGQYHSKKEKSLWMMVGKPDEGKPRHYMLLTYLSSLARQASPGSTTVYSRLQQTLYSLAGDH